jgi:hypothetical protein
MAQEAPGQTLQATALVHEAYLRLVDVNRLTDIDGLWRKGCKGTRGSVARPGSITEYIRQRGLLPSEEIDRLVAQVPKQIVAYHEAFA